MPRAPSFRHAPAVESALSPIAALVTVGAGVLAWQAVWLGAWLAVLFPIAGEAR